MGNRAVITTKEKRIGVYLHWNGGRDSVRAFLTYCKLKGYRCPENDNYGWARLCQIIGNFLGGNLSIGIDTLEHLDCDNFDNGVYIIENWEIVGREFFKGAEQDVYDLVEMLKSIDECQPKDEQLGDFITAKEVPVSEIKVGDTVYIQDSYANKIEKHIVVGIGEDKIVNKTNVKGIPYVDKWGSNPADNINNYIRTDKIKVVE